MRTGFDQTQQSFDTTHKMAVVTGATAVFMKHLCQDMMMVHMLTGDNNMAQIAQACAARIMQSKKCADIEAIVEAVLAHPDGLPYIENTKLLAEIMQRYSETAAAEQAGTAKHFRKNTLVPDIVSAASTQNILSEEEAVSFIESINSQEAFKPTSAFQQIVYSAINTLQQDMTWT